MSNNASLSKNERYVIEIRDKAKTIEWFGEDYLNEYGVVLPKELIDRYNKNKSEFNEIQKELESYLVD